MLYSVMAKAIKKKAKIHHLHQVKKKASEIIHTPLGIQAISIISYIAAAVFIIAGVGLFIGGIILQQESEVVNAFLQVLIANPDSEFSSISPIAKAAITSVLTYSGPVLIALGLVFFFIGILRIFVGLSLLQGKAWSRVVVVCFCLIWIGFAFYNLAKGSIWVNILTIVFNLIVLYYLLFSKEVHNFFHHIPNRHLHPGSRGNPQSTTIIVSDHSQQKLSNFIRNN